MGVLYSPKIVTDGLVLALDAANPKSYPGSGTTWTDLSGNGNNGTLTNGPTFDGGNLGSISFDGVDDAVIIPQDDTFFTNQWTWQGWVYYITNVPTYNGIFWAEGVTDSAPGTSGYQWLFSFVNVHTSGCYAHYRVYNTTTNWTNTDFNIGHSLINSWYYVSWSFDNGTTKLYLNDSLIHTNTSRGAYNGGTTSRIFLGCRNDFALESNFKLTGVSYYNRALSAEEVLQNYNATKPRYNL